MEIIKTDTHYNFVRMMKPAVILSLAVIIIGIASLIWHGGPNYGIDFAGGTLIQIKFQNETPTDKIRAAFKSIGFEGSVIQNYGPKEVIVRTAESGTDAKGLTSRVDEALGAAFGKGAYEVRRIEMVGPKVGKDLTRKAILAIIFSWIGILDLCRGAVRIPLRAGRDHRADSRRTGDDYLSLPLQQGIRPEYRGGAADDHRVLDQRHDRHLRPDP